MNQLLQWLSELCQGARVWAVVLPWERGLRVRLGRWTRVWGPGLHWRLPFLDVVRVVNTRVRVASVPCITVTTRDGRTVTAAGVVAFRLVDPLKVLLTVQQPEDAAASFAQAALAEYVVGQRVEDLGLTWSVASLENFALEALRKAPLEGFAFEFVKVVDFAVVRTYRLLQETWRPTSTFSNLEPPRP